MSMSNSNKKDENKEGFIYTNNNNDPFGSDDDDDDDEEDDGEEDTRDIEVPLADKRGQVQKPVPPAPQAQEPRKPPSSSPPPTRSEVQKRVAERVVEKMSDIRANNPVRSPTATQINQATKAVNSLSQEQHELSERARLSRKLNEKRKKYGGKIDFKFKPNYDALKMTWEQLKVEDDESDIIINSQDVPTVLLAAMIQIAGVLEQAAKNLGYSGLSGFAKNVAINAQTGFFNSELEQLSIEMKEVFARPPKQRLAMKLGLVAYKTWEQNNNIAQSGGAGGAMSPMPIPTSMMREKGKDL